MNKRVSLQILYFINLSQIIYLFFFNFFISPHSQKAIVVSKNILKQNNPEAFFSLPKNKSTRKRTPLRY